MFFPGGICLMRHLHNIIMRQKICLEGYTLSTANRDLSVAWSMSVFAAGIRSPNRGGGSRNRCRTKPQACFLAHLPNIEDKRRTQGRGTGGAESQLQVAREAKSESKIHKQGNRRRDATCLQAPRFVHRGINRVSFARICSPANKQWAALANLRRAQKRCHGCQYLR